MKHILVITHAGGSPFHGPNMRWYYLGHALRPLGVEVEIVSSSSFHKYTSPPVIDSPIETAEVNGLTYHWMKTTAYKGRGVGQVRNQLQFVARCYQFIEFLASRSPDLVVASSPHPFTVFPARHIAHKAGGRFVYEVRDLWPEVLLELGNFARLHPYIVALSWAERYGVKHAERIISVKPGDGEYFREKYGTLGNKFSHVPNGFLPENIDVPVPETIRLLRDRYQFIVGYVGALSIYYGLDHLLELANHYRDRVDIGFVVVGKGDHLDRLQNKASKLGLENFHLVGPVPKQTVPIVLAQLDVCYVGLEDLAIHKYGISCNKIYEYMHAGKPIVGSYRAGHDPVSAANCGFVSPPGDYGPLIAGIDSLVAQPELAIDLGVRARRYFNKVHDFSVVAVQLKALLFPENKSQSEEKAP